MGRKRILGLFVVAAILVGLCFVLAWFFLPTAQTPLTITAMLKELTGGVDFTRSGAVRMAAYSGLQLQAKDKVYTAIDGRVRLDLSDGSITRLGPNTLFVMGGTEGSEGSLIYRMTLYMGEVWVILNGGEMEVATPYGLATVRGSFMHVKIGRMVEETVITCLEGSCTVANDMGEVDLVAGLGARISNLRVPPKVRPITPAEVEEWIAVNPEALEILPQLTATVGALPAVLPTARPGVQNWCPGEPGWITIKAQAGDTIASLAQKLGVNPGELARASCVSPQAELNPGTVLFAPFDPLRAPPIDWVTSTIEPTVAPILANFTLPPTIPPAATVELTSTPPPPQTDLPASTETSVPSQTSIPIPAQPTAIPAQPATAIPAQPTAIPPQPAPTPTFCEGVNGISVAECDVLVALYNSTNGSGWIDQTNWLVTNTPCSWYGVTCSGGYITQLSLVDNQLSGNIPVELARLTNLTVIDFQINQLTSNIPSSLGSLTNLTQLSVNGNQLSGTIPPELGSLANLTALGLSYNQLSGTIPSELGNLTNLVHLYLNYSLLSGPMPDNLRNLVVLKEFYYPDIVCVPPTATPEFMAWIDAVIYHTSYTICP